MTVFDACRTNLLARPTTKTAIDVSCEGARRGVKTALGDGPHEIDAAAWSIVLVSGDYVCRAGFEAQTAVNAGEKLFFESGIISRGERG